jgi:hypothetical protein
MDMDWNIVSEIPTRAGSLLLLVGGATALLVGLGLVLVPGAVFRCNEYCCRWISMRRFFGWMDKSIDTDPWISRHARSFGPLLFLASAALLAWLVFFYNHPMMVRFFATHFNLDAVRLVEPIVITLLLTFSALGVILGALIWGRSRWLYELERRGSHWYSLQKATRFLDTMHHSMDRFAVAHPRILGSFLVVGGAGICGTSFWMK